MRLKLYRAATIAQAMSQVRLDLGPEALILSTRRTGDGVELTAAIDPADTPPSPLPEPPADLARHGLPADLLARLSGPELERRLAGLLRFDAQPGMLSAALHQGRVLFAGLPGAGKTLSVAKLATQSVLAGVKPAVITTDGRRAGAAEELAAYTRLLGLELIVAGSPATLRRALAAAACQAAGPVLIDTSGLNPFVPAELAILTELVQAAEAEPVLVMAAGQDAAESAEQAQAFASAGIGHLLVTRLDLARRVGGVVTAAHAARLTLTLACAAPCATVPPEPMTPALLAARLAPPAPAPLRHRPPVFPAARTQAANGWSADRHV